MTHTLTNGTLTLSISTFGAEITSIKDKEGHEYIWTGQPEYWNRHAPILFPCIGNNWNQEILINGNAYALQKHGFVNQMEWELVQQTEHSISFSVCDTPQTRQNFPYSFNLTVTYALIDAKVEVCWEVRTNGKEEMPFMIGAHPAFLLPEYNDTDTIHGFLQTSDVDSLVSTRTIPYGYAQDELQDIFTLDNDMLPLTNTTFSGDTILDKRGKIKEMTLLDKHQKPIVKMNFIMPVLAIWAPKNGQCPFVCIEPWCGCCDDYQKVRPFANRPFINKVSPTETWSNTYSIEIL